MEKSNYYKTLIKEAQKLSPKYKIGDIEGISNHLPMCLHARHMLGASIEQLERFYESYIESLELKNQDVLENFNWIEHLGKHKFSAEYSKFFNQQILENGINNTLEHYLPILFKGVGGAAFHPLIRLSYALEMKDDSEVAEALASWCMGYLELNSAIEDTNRFATEIITTLSLLEITDDDISAPSVYLRMKKANGLKLFKSDVQNPKNLKVNELADLALKVFLSEQNFTTLHMITATHALRLVLPYIRNKKEALKYYWIAFASTYISVKSPSVENLISDAPILSWKELSNKAIKSDDDHWCKFVYTCMEEDDVYTDNRYLIAANLYLKD